MSPSLKMKLVGSITAIVMLACVSSASAYGTGPTYCGAAMAGGYNLSGGPQVAGVYACGPLPFMNGGGPAIPTFWPLSGADGGFQCTEFARRYLYTVTKGDLVNLSNLSGRSFVSTAASQFNLPMFTPGPGSVPQPGDIISEWGDPGTDAHGHVAVVVAVSGAKITTLGENETTNGLNTISMPSAPNWSVNGNGFYHYTHFAWLRPSPRPASGSTFVMTSAGSDFGAVQQWSNQLFAGTKATLAGDVDGDSRTDLVAVDDASSWVMRSTGSGFSAPQLWSSSAFYGTKTTLAGDVNGDGRSDLIAVNDASSWVMLSTGSGFSASQPWSGSAFYGTKATLAGDVNGDSRSDLVAVNDASSWVMRSTGSGFSAPQPWSSGAFYGTKATLAGDVNGDGKSDLIAVNDASTWLMLSTGAGFSAPQQSSNGAFYGTLMTVAGDVNSDHKSDLIAVNYDPGT
jgi:hypothetical protein